MTLDEIYARAEAQGVEIDEVHTAAVSAMSFPEGWIAFDPAKFETSADIKTALAHELGHIESGSFYSTLTPYYTRAKCEYKADKKAILMLIPREKFDCAVKDGCTEIWQLAEYFGATEQLVRRACCLYGAL